MDSNERNGVKLTCKSCLFIAGRSMNQNHLGTRVLEHLLSDHHSTNICKLSESWGAFAMCSKNPVGVTVA